jgi:glycosyltransferase involved in cell wall biosynthesis
MNKKKLNKNIFLNLKHNYPSSIKLLSFLLFIFIILQKKNRKNIKDNKDQILLKSYINYVNICDKLIRLNTTKIKNKLPFLSVCIPIYNTDKYIEKAILSIINQSFQDFEIIIINDFSNDNTRFIIEKMEKEDDRIKIINHNKNLGVYHSRVEAVLNSNGKYILFLDPDDMFLNQDLFKKLFYFNKNYNFDIIEFLVLNRIDRNNKIYYPRFHYSNHNHSYIKAIIYQPELSDIIFYKPRSKNYSSIICRTIWNKIFKREIQLKTIKYIGKDFYWNNYLIVADDTLLNIINFHFANNYTNIKLPGYLYLLKKNSMSRGYINKEYRKKQNISFFYYYYFLYKYIKEFDKDRHFFFYDLKLFKGRLFEFKNLNDSAKINKLKLLLYEIKNDSKSFDKLKILVNKMLTNLNDKTKRSQKLYKIC